eukprot:scaffold84_cov163-Amphora_coffeaeformis.AAC.19
MSVVYRLTRFATLTTGVVGGAAAFRYNKVLQRQAEEWPKSPLELPTSTPDVIVIGGGVVGIAAAYSCAQKGQKVLLIEPNSVAGQECTSCAAGGMQRSTAVVNRNTWLAVLKSSFGNGYQFFHIDWLRTLTDPFFLRWIFTFSTTSLLPGPEQDAKQIEMLKFTQFAVDEMIKFMNKNMAKASGYNPSGSLSVSYDPPVNEKELKAINPSASKLNREPHRMLNSSAEILKVEPSLRFQEKLPQTAKYEYKSSAASAERYTIELARACAQHPNVTSLYQTAVRGLQVEQSADASKPHISALHTTGGVLTVAPQTQVLIAAGAWTPHLLATADLYAPVYPLKGYALSLSASKILKQSSTLKSADLPSRVVADAFMYTSRLGDEIRITSIGEFSGWSTQPTPEVDEEFRREAARQFPQLVEYLPAAETRCGHRPYVNDGLVLMGRCPEFTNLLVSCGPGSNGWKMAMGSAMVIQGLAAGKTEQQLSKELGFDVTAFGPANRVVSAPLFAKLCRARWNV